MEDKELEQLILIRDYAFSKHESVNHLYNGYPYSVHLTITSAFVWKYLHLFTLSSKGKLILLAASFCHDLIEDTRLTYHDLNTDLFSIVNDKIISQEISNIVYALTNEKGKNRHERANAKYYEGIRSIEYATFIKICDRIANIYYSTKENNNKKLNMYINENKNFIESLCGEENSDEVLILKQMISENFKIII